MTVEPASTRANRINSDSLDWSYIGISFTLEHSASARCAGPAIHGSFTFDTERMAAVGQLYAGPDASICEARASACVSMYSRMLVSLPSRTVMAKIQSSSNGLFVALTFPVAKPTTSTRSPCATNSRGSVDVSIDLEAVSNKSASPACPRCVPASGQSLPGMIPLDVLGGQRQQTLPVAAADR